MEPGRARLIGICAAVLAAVIVVQSIRSRPDPAVPPVGESNTAADPYGGCVALGQVMQFNMNVQSKLRNPASFEHVSSEIGPVDNGVFAVATVYRATNGFGAVDTAIATGKVRTSDCAAKVVSIE